VIRRSIFALGLLSSLALSSSLGAQAPAAAPPAAVTPNDYTDDKAWLCRPGRKGDACDIDLTTTVIAADGTTTREAFAADPKAPIDCFYVYPTVSTDTTPNSDMTADPAETNVVAQQFARFASKCRPFAPLYRQVTLAGLRTRLANPTSLGSGLAYDDVEDAWNDYLKRDNGGRGVVLIGHSQGSYILMQLIRNEIEGKPIQKRIVSAILLGTTLEVPPGKDVGGGFKTLPLCRTASQVGCVITYGSYRSTFPPPANARFGRPTTAGMSAACINPAALKDGGPAPLHSYLSTAGRTITGTTAPKPWVEGKTIDTPWVSVPGLLTAKCATNENATFLEVTVNGNPADPRADDIVGDIGMAAKPLADWGLHLVDMNLSMGNLLDIVGQQAKAFK
jgi:Protein of unknown function (DUF3089)